ncbi:pilin, partial [Francisella tularensis subsp. holarctica]
IVCHNGRIVGVSTIKGTTYQIALTPRIEGGTLNWTCSISIVEKYASFDNSYNGQVFFGFIDNNSISYAAPSSSMLPRGLMLQIATKILISKHIDQKDSP